jgi:hypothetical protein
MVFVLWYLVVVLVVIVLLHKRLVSLVSVSKMVVVWRYLSSKILVSFQIKDTIRAGVVQL